MNFIDFYNSQNGQNYFNFVFTKNFTRGAMIIDQKLYLRGKDKNVCADDFNTYKVNSDKFRTKDFTKDKVNVLAAGCSFTFGVGVPKEGTWPTLIDAGVNLGQPGISAESILLNITRYINEYGIPKNIVCLFPDPYRLNFIHDKDLHHAFNDNLQIWYSEKELENVDKVQNQTIVKNKFIKVPFNLHENISPHFTIYKAIDSIYLLQSLCKAHGINLIWSTWDHSFSLLLDIFFENENFYLDKSNYVKTGWGSVIEDKICNSDHNHELKDNVAWRSGTDLNNHPGIHYNYHIAEVFKDKLKEKVNE